MIKSYKKALCDPNQEIGEKSEPRTTKRTFTTNR